MEGSINEALASGIDPMGYEVSAAKLRQLVQESPPDNDRLKRKLLTYLERRVIKGRTTVKCVLLGSAVADFAERTDDEDIIPIAKYLNNLDRMPYVVANGRLIS